MPKRSWLDRPIQKFRGYRQEPGRRPLLPHPPSPVDAAPKPPPPEPSRPPSPLRPPPPEPVAFKQPKATAAHIIRWIEERCRVASGPLIGKPFLLDDWQKAEIERIYDNPLGTRRAILSVARKCGKTGLASVLLLVHLIGPKARPNSQLYSTAQSREQAALIFAMAAKIVRMSPDLRDSVIIRESIKQLYCPDLGTMYRALSAEAKTAYGLDPVFVVHDELGQVRGPRSALYDALETATGAQEEPLSIIISTQAPTDADLLSVLIDDALAGHDPRVICKLYTAPPTLPPFEPDTIRLANPAFGTFLNSKEVLSMAADAQRMPSREAEYRNLILNQRVEACQQYLQPAQWAACGTPVGDLTQVKEIYGGLDLSEANDLTALVLIGKINGVWHCRSWFWMPGASIFERSRTDHVPYDRWVQDGWLETVEGEAITYDRIAERICQILGEHKGLQKIAFDRWNFAQFRPWLSFYGWTSGRIESKWVEFGQGTQSMSPALRELESRVLRRELAHGNNPILNMCAANAVVEGNKDGTLKKDSSARKLSKKRSTGRIDGMIALAMAMGIAPMGAPVDISALIG
jgi:phage terminase large subunit-like protein